MRVRVLPPERQLTASLVNRRSPEQTLIAGRQRHGEDGANDNRIVDDDESERGMKRARQRQAACVVQALR